MRLIFSSFLLFLTTVLFAQSNLKDQLPLDPKVSKGVLENGLTYYVRSNDNPKNRAELYLVVRAGSVEEDDDQQGLAHFCEHMSFNGTKNFPKHELVNYFESIGMDFGAEINAYTSFDQTVYNITVPLDSAIYIEKGLQVLYDWACQVTDSDDEINNERGVIHEEWRLGRGANDRMMRKWLPVLFHDSKYAERLPIGKMDIVDHCPPDAIRRFRHDWYRPDLQAVIVVGDFDQDKMVQEVKEKFSAIPVLKNEREEKIFDIPDHKETLISIATDKEAQYSVAYMYYKHPMEITKTLGDYRESIMQSIYNSMINNRLAEKTQQANPPFILAQSAYTEMMGGPKSVYESVAVTQNGKIGEGLKAALLENVRVLKYGFTQTELDRQKAALLTSMQKAYNERNKRKSISFANEYERNFLMTKDPIPGIENEYKYFKEFMPGITLAEVNDLAKNWITEENRVVVITAPEKEGVKVPTEDEVREILKEAETADIKPYVDAVSNVPLVEYEPAGSKIVKERKLEKVDATEWTLGNGAVVVVKPTDFKDDEILFNAWSLGGSSLYKVKDDVSANFTTDVMEESGIADFDKIKLDKMLSDKVFSLSPYISELREGFNGSSSIKDAKTMLKMLYLYFTDPRFDQTSFQSLMTRYSGILENRSASPEAAFSDTLQVTLANYDKHERPLTKELLSEANFNRIRQIGHERFKNASDFKFFFVGNIDTSKFKPLVEKYIGGIPSLPEKENWVDLHIEKPNGVIEKFVKKGKDDKCIQYIVFHGKFDFNSQNQIQLDAVGRILTTRLLEVIREDKSSVYSISAQPSSGKFPEPEYTIKIVYGASPEKLAELKTAIFDIISEFEKKGPSEVELNKAKEKMLREHETSLRENGYWLSILSNTYYIKNGDFSKYGNFDKLVNNLTVKSTKSAFKKYFDFKNYISVALEPAE